MSLNVQQIKIENVPALFRRVFDTPDGQKILLILQNKFVSQNPYDDNPTRTAFNCGAQKPIEYILEQIVTKEK